MYLIAGLGNPGEKYARTRHNAGFILFDEMLPNAKWKKSRTGALVCKDEYFGEEVLFVKPQNFMNLSGESISSLARKKGIQPENIIVVADDIYFDVGEIRVRKKGSAGGHNGMKSIIECLGTECFPRIKVGVGKKPDSKDLANFVLEKLSKEELIVLKGVVGDVEDRIRKIFRDNLA